MKITLLTRAFFLGALAAYAHVLLAQPVVPAARPLLERTDLEARAVMPKPAQTVYYQGLFRDRIVVKFKEGARVRPESLAGVSKPAPSIAKPAAPAPKPAAGPRPQLTLPVNRLTARDRSILQKQNLTTKAVQNDLARVNALLRRPEVRAWGPLFSRSAAALNTERLRAEVLTDLEHADLSNYYSITLRDDRESTKLVDELNALDSVEIAYLAPIGEDADIAPPTPSYEANQGYLDAAPTGIDARFAWTQNGGRGAGVRIIDIEQGWNLAHEDLRAAFLQNGVIKGGNSRQHGTAVLGEMVARNDGHGVTGIVPDARHGVVSAARRRSFLFFSWEEYNLAEAINVAAARLSAGDVILIEQHARGPASGQACACNCGQFEYVAMEYWQAEYDAIRAATARGIVVVEAAGNGGMNLGAARYGGRFNRATRDSGAILVGGGTSNTRAPMCWTNFGDRVDVQGWGQNVMTLGYGDIRANGNDDRQWYATGFSGTSSASPIVTGAVAAIQGIRKFAGLEGLRPRDVRTLINQTGTAQTGANQIGPLPDLRAAINRLDLEDCIGFNPNNVSASRINGQWKVVDGSSWLIHYGADGSGAAKARDVIRHYGMNNQCFIGRPNPSLAYYLVGNTAPAGPVAGEDCLPINPGALAVRSIGGRWKIVQGSVYVLDFGSKRNEADAALRVIQRHAFARICYVRRPNPPMTYLRR